MDVLLLLLLCINSVQSLGCVQLFVAPWTVACQVSLSITNSQSLLKLMPIELVVSSNHLILLKDQITANKYVPLNSLF